MSKSGPFSAVQTGKYNVYFPANSAKPYVAFDKLAEAKAAVKAKGTGVILDKAGHLDPKQQVWSGWSSYQSQFPAPAVVLNPGGPAASTPPPPPTGTATATPGSINVWVPPQYLSQASLAPAQGAPAFTNGAYVAFPTQHDAKAFVESRNTGIIFDADGKLHGKQPWAAAAQLAPQARNAELTTKPTANEINVWFPDTVVSRLGTLPPHHRFTHGAYLTMRTLHDAQAEVTARGVGVILEADGSLATKQPWYRAAAAFATLTNDELTPKPTKDTVNVWTPTRVLGQIGIQDPKKFPHGAYLSFATEAKAQAHVKAIGVGVILDNKGAPDKTQPWASAPSFIAQLANDDLITKPKAGAFNVWFPEQQVYALGALKHEASFKHGAYLAFDSAAAARAHVEQRGFGVLFDDAGEPAAKQPWSGAGQYLAQRLNDRLTAQPTPNAFNVWTPADMVDSLGLKNTTAVAGGAYISFATEAEAEEHAKQRGFGIVLDKAGKPAAKQPWASYGTYVAQLANSGLVATPAPGKFHVWFPQNNVRNLGTLPVGGFFSNGAYLPFDTLAEAEAHAKLRGSGVVLDTHGNMAKTQPWGSAKSYAAQLDNTRLTTKPTSGKFNVWTPSNYVSSLGLASPGAFAQGAYLAYDSEADAVARVKRAGFGVVMNTTGAAAAKQPWDQAGPFVAQLQNVNLATTRKAGEVSVWFPQSCIARLGGVDVKKFPVGAWLSFDSVTAARTHAKERGFGVVIDKDGSVDAKQPWSQAAQFTSQLSNDRMTAAPPSGQVSVWFPQAALNAVGVEANSFPIGAYLAFNSAAEAQAEVTKRSAGVVLDANGALDATQPWPQAAQYAVQLENPRLTATPPKDAVSVWFPYQQLQTVGVARAAFPTGAYLTFPTEADAEAHVTARGVGVVLNKKGDVATKQPWAQAAGVEVQLSNRDFTASRTDGEFSVWFPPDTLNNVGADAVAFPSGAYLAFKTLAEAKAHAKKRGSGVILDAKGAYHAKEQTWANASTYVPAWPPPKTTKGDKPITGGTADILGVWNEPTAKGSHVVIRTHGAILDETMSYDLYTTINGTLVKIKELGTKTMTPGSYVLDADFELDYAELSSILQQSGASLSIGRGSKLSVMVNWPSGHNQGSGQGGAGHDTFVGA